MADFHQSGSIATLHNLRTTSTEAMTRELEIFGATRKINLILPSLFSELEGDALPNILTELNKVPYLNKIVIGLDRATEDEYKYAREFFSRLNINHDILWNDGPRLQAIDERLKTLNLSPNEPGKGRNVWFCIGYTLAQAEAHVPGDVQMREDGVGLEHHVGRAQVGRDIGHVAAADQHAAGGHVLEPRDGAQQRRLPAAGRAQKREELTFPDLAGNAAKGMIIIVILLDLIQNDKRVLHRKPPVSFAPVRRTPRRRKNSATVSSTSDRITRIVPKAMTTGIRCGKRN